VTPQNEQATTKLREWVQKGYFNPDYDSVGFDVAATEFAKGDGIFYYGGNWQAGIIRQGLKENVGAVMMPAGPSGKVVSGGSGGAPWHISSKCKYPDVAAAWINYVINSKDSNELMYSQYQIPASRDAKPPAGDPLLTSLTNGWQQLGADGGLTLYPDWASPTMLQTASKNLTSAIAGRTTATNAASAIQADWAKFNAELTGGG
jgi:raffinose/stachyose/melibiose transport system substrate-binding protein